MKRVNRYTSNEFHDWQRSRLPRDLVMQDIDAWAISVADPARAFRPVALFELKRSFMSVARWRPFDADRNNYAALIELGRAAGLPVFIVYFEKGREITDTTPFGVFRLDTALPQIRFARQEITAADFLQRFPYPVRDAG